MRATTFEKRVEREQHFPNPPFSIFSSTFRNAVGTRFLTPVYQGEINCSQDQLLSRASEAAGTALQLWAAWWHLAGTQNDAWVTIGGS